MHITLFFTHGTSLRAWERSGMFEREVALYRKYLEKGHRISFVTYGRKDKKRYADKLKGIEILDNPFGLPAGVYATLVSLQHGLSLHKTDIFKTNQTPGALAALRAGRLFGKPVIARCGYMHSEFIARQQGHNSPDTLKVIDEESKIFSKADRIEVTTPMMRDSIIDRLPDTAGKIRVIPNYVDTDIFVPSAGIRDIDLLFVGRLNPQKNLPVLFEALQGLGLRIAIIGSGAQETELRNLSISLGLDIIWAGNVPNHEIARYFNRSRLFILPSLYEGHPKTLIEAMAAGLPVIGTDVPGIREVILHGKTGWICKTDAESIRASIVKLTASDALCDRLGIHARRFALNNYSLGMILEKELLMIEEILIPMKPLTSRKS